MIIASDSITVDSCWEIISIWIFKMEAEGNICTDLLDTNTHD